MALTGRTFSVPTAQVLAAGEMTVTNTFDRPRAIATKPLDGLVVKGSTVHATLPPGAVAAAKGVPAKHRGGPRKSVI